MRCSHIDEAASPKAKPLAPAATPPTSAPSQRKMSVSRGIPAIIRSTGIEDEDEADGANRGDTGRQHRQGLLAKIEEFDGEDAQAECHMSGQRDHEAEFRKFHQWLTRDREKRIHCLGAVERSGEREEMQR